MAPRRSSRKSLNTASEMETASSATDNVRSSRPVKAEASRSSSRNTTKRTLASRTFVPNSDSEDELLDTKKPKKVVLPFRRVLKEVAIPSRMGLMETAPARQSSTGSASLDASDYETPSTSISTTPALSIRLGKLASKSGPSSAVNASLGGPSSRNKRSREVVPDSDEEDDQFESDAKLARQLQLEEDLLDQQQQNMSFGERYTLDTDEEEMPLAKRARTASGKGKGKGKAKAKAREVISLDSDDEIDLAPTTTPAYKGKGKGKAKADDPPSSARGRSTRSAAKGKMSMVIDDLSDEDSDDADSYKPDDDEMELDLASLNGDDIIDLVSNSTDDIPTLPIAKRRAPMTEKLRRGWKSKSLTMAQKIERNRRLARFAHITDKWERKRAMNRERAEQSHPKLLTMWKDLEQVPVLKVQQIEQPDAITRRLKPFQLEGVSWMIRQEKTGYKGGLLGDEMGMGKTIQAVSLIMSDFPAKNPTLVVVPPVALLQWSNEIKEYTDGKLNVLVYHGTNAKCKKMTIKDLKKFDVIMVSYNSLESLHRKETKGWTRGEDIIKEASPLHAIHYHRLILDEAHSIKSRTTGVAKACFALKGSYKWCLSGTPVQNRIGEFFSLLRFLEVRPFADYFCRSCDCEQLHWSVDEDYLCKACGHGASEHISVFNQELLNPITGDDPELREEALTKLHMVTARIMLRRMKRDHTNSMELPMKDIVIHNEFFSEVERDFSTSIMSNSARKFDTYVAQGVMLNNYANIFGLIMQMRQVANHPDLLLKKSSAEGSQNVYVCNICDEPAEDAVRSRCHHEFCRACVKDFVETCEASGTDADCPRCHIALSIDFEQPELEQDEDSVKKTSIINRIKMENWTSSTKIEMLVYDLYKLRSKKQTLKSIVFSQFTSMLQLIEWRLRRAGFNTVMLDGSMTPAQRQKSIEHFMTNPDVEVFLVSLKAGGVALNLTEASRVFIVDPWWNPAAEWQSADRCHRIGQKRPCVITRLCIEDSVESRMVALQEKKAAMIAGTVNNDKVALDRLTPEDLQFLFRGS
ncbi:helicase SWR1 [Byssothecium circinans]|uniref:Helicase SWR1 n=1 Tax=Byssothecium circinans TaxID=147558 RepID=A0A6A5U1C8_9PLEO|nr:helicase SWR1 [Byssothecium circinans]